MGAAKKHRRHYPVESRRPEQSNRDKAAIEQYRRKIEDMLEKDPQLQKKAADIVAALINSNKK